MRNFKATLLAAALGSLILLLPSCNRFSFPLLRTDPVRAEDVDIDLFLIGDAGLPAPGREPVLEALKREIAWDTTRTLVVYLGDNIYPEGLAAEGAAGRAEGERILDAQLDVLRRTGVRGFFVPGNHDWEADAPGGWDAVRRQERYVEANGGRLAVFIPNGGCPGPEVHDYAANLRLVFLDTQWWLHDGPKPRAGSDCPTDTEREVVDSLDRALASAAGRHVVVIGHHPMASGGQHGGYFDWPTYLFAPYPLARRLGFANQDVSSRPYTEMRRAFARVFRKHRPLVYAAGHEHNLQILEGGGTGAQHLLVSGTGIYNHTTSVQVLQRTTYAREASGFMRMTVLRDGRVRLGVLVVDRAGNAREDFSFWLAAGPATPPVQMEEDDTVPGS